MIQENESGPVSRPDSPLPSYTPPHSNDPSFDVNFSNALLAQTQEALSEELRRNRENFDRISTWYEKNRKRKTD